MSVSEANASLTRGVLALSSVAVLIAAACAPQPAAPTAAPAKPAPTAAPAQAAAPTAKPAATTAPAAKPTVQPAAKTAAFDEKAVADFYKGKTIRIVISMAPGGGMDTNARLIQQVLSKYIPGSPTVVVENKPGGGGLLAANTVYNSEAKDGTVIGAVSQPVVLQQAIGAQGVQFDVAKFNWLGATYDSVGQCAARPDTGITRIQDIMEGGKELTVSSFGKGTASYDTPAVLNAALGTRFKIITGYEGGAQQRLAVQNKEVQGFCTSFDTASMGGVVRSMFEGDKPISRILIMTGAETSDQSFLKGVPAAEKLAKTEEAKALLRAADAPGLMNLPFAVAPEVPRDRVEALRRALDKAYADPEYRAGAEKANQPVKPKTGEEVTRIIRGLLETPPATLAKLREVLK